MVEQRLLNDEEERRRRDPRPARAARPDAAGRCSHKAEGTSTPAGVRQSSGCRSHARRCPRTRPKSRASRSSHTTDSHSAPERARVDAPAAPPSTASAPGQGRARRAPGPSCDSSTASGASTERASGLTATRAGEHADQPIARGCGGRRPRPRPRRGRARRGGISLDARRLHRPGRGDAEQGRGSERSPEPASFRPMA